MVRVDESAGSLTLILVTNKPADVSFTVQVCTEDIEQELDLGMATGNHSYKIFLRLQLLCAVLNMHIGVVISIGVVV